MIKSAADLAYVNADGSMVYPMGPCCAWPQSRNSVTPIKGTQDSEVVLSKTRVKASAKEMAGGFVETTIKAVTRGKVDADTRESRYSMCLNCDKFIKQSKRCSECGCFMQAKTWINGASCPIGKW